jgi:hypothetical protein
MDKFHRASTLARLEKGVSNGVNFRIEAQPTAFFFAYSWCIMGIWHIDLHPAICYDYLENLQANITIEMLANGLNTSPGLLLSSFQVFL